MRTSRFPFHVCKNGQVETVMPAVVSPLPAAHWNHRLHETLGSQLNENVLFVHERPNAEIKRREEKGEAGYKVTAGLDNYCMGGLTEGCKEAYIIILALSTTILQFLKKKQIRR
uniref:Uncharacterized protein n=1 Tax=Oryza brachyantha TaxID=4533 RepID=J3N2F3_ORYBR